MLLSLWRMGILAEEYSYKMMPGLGISDPLDLVSVVRLRWRDLGS